MAELRDALDDERPCEGGNGNVTRAEGWRREGREARQSGLTSIHNSSLSLSASSLGLLAPLTAWRLLGGALSSTAVDAGLFLSSILAKVAGRGTEGEVAIGIRKGLGEGGNQRKKAQSREPGPRRAKQVGQCRRATAAGWTGARG